MSPSGLSACCTSSAEHGWPLFCTIDVRLEPLANNSSTWCLRKNPPVIDTACWALRFTAAFLQGAGDVCSTISIVIVGTGPVGEPVVKYASFTFSLRLASKPTMPSTYSVSGRRPVAVISAGPLYSLSVLAHGPIMADLIES